MGMPVKQIDRPCKDRQQHIKIMGYYLDGNMLFPVKLRQQFYQGTLA